MMIEGFLEELRDDYFETPTVVTKENVNTPLYWRESKHRWTLLYLSISRNYIDVVQRLLMIGAEITGNDLGIAWDNIEILRILFEAGANPALLGKIQCGSSKCCKLVLDYGGKLSSPHIKEKWKDIHDYNLLVSSHVASSRKALAALIISCKRGLFPLRDVGVAFAREMWVQRGPSGCGPRRALWARAYEWSK